MLFPENEECVNMLTAVVTITLVTEEAPNGFLQKEVKINKNKETMLKDVTTCALKMFNEFFKEQNYSFRLKEDDLNYSVIASADNKIKDYNMENKLEDFEILDFAFNYKVNNIISVSNESTIRCLFCICF